MVGACFLVRRDAFEAVGGFDERFWLYGEEADLCRRMCDAGWSVRHRRRGGLPRGRGQRAPGSRTWCSSTSSEAPSTSWPSTRAPAGVVGSGWPRWSGRWLAWRRTRPGVAARVPPAPPGPPGPGAGVASRRGRARQPGHRRARRRAGGVLARGLGRGVASQPVPGARAAGRRSRPPGAVRGARLRRAPRAAPPQRVAAPAPGAAARRGPTGGSCGSSRSSGGPGCWALRRRQPATAGDRRRPSRWASNAPTCGSTTRATPALARDTGWPATYDITDDWTAPRSRPRARRRVRANERRLFARLRIGGGVLARSGRQPASGATRSGGDPERGRRRAPPRPATSAHRPARSGRGSRGRLRGHAAHRSPGRGPGGATGHRAARPGRGAGGARLARRRRRRPPGDPAQRAPARGPPLHLGAGLPAARRRGHRPPRGHAVHREPRSHQGLRVPGRGPAHGGHPGGGLPRAGPTGGVRTGRVVRGRGRPGAGRAAGAGPRRPRRRPRAGRLGRPGPRVRGAARGGAPPTRSPGRGPSDPTGPVARTCGWSSSTTAPSSRGARSRWPGCWAPWTRCRMARSSSRR